MSDTGIGTFTVGSHAYKFEELAPTDALRFGVKVTKSLGPALAKLGEAATNAAGKTDPKELVAAFGPALGMVDDAVLEELLRTAMQRVYTPQNESLSNEAVFNAWFREHKEDLFPVGLYALYHLTKDFFPKALATAVNHFQK